MTRTPNKAGRGLAVRLLGAGACGTLLAGAGTAAALAAPAPDAPKETAASGTFDVDQITRWP